MAIVNLQGQDVYLDDFIIEKLDNVKKILKKNYLKYIKVLNL